MHIGVGEVDAIALAGVGVRGLTLVGKEELAVVVVVELGDDDVVIVGAVDGR